MKKKNWESTRKIFINWLSSNELKEKFSKDLCYKDLSLWWLTTLYEKDNINSQEWYGDLNKTFFEKNFLARKDNSYFVIGIFKLIKRFFSSIFFNIFIKIFYREKQPTKDNIKNCLYALFTNLTEYKGSFIDRQYGLYGQKKKKDFVYYIDFYESFDLIKNYFSYRKKLSKIPFKYYLSAKNISLYQIIKIYFFCFMCLIKINIILIKKNFFIINNKDCSNILKKLVINSFFGSIQRQLIKGYSLNKCLRKAKIKNFINCFDFHPESRCIYYFANTGNVKNTININHYNYSKNNLFSNFKSNEFSKSNKNCKYFSPYPDIFFCQGKKYFHYLKNTFKKINKNIFIIGSLKLELNKSNTNFNKNLLRASKNKTLLILCSINDYNSFIKILNNCNLKNFDIIVAPHPLKKEKTLEEFRINFKKKFISNKNMNMTEVINTCDYIIFGDTSLGLELSIMNKNIFRVYDSEFVPKFDIDNEIPTATDYISVQKLLRKKIIKQKSKLIEKNYFYKYDTKASQRLTSILNKF